jgi:hypothetical protein
MTEIRLFNKLTVSQPVLVCLHVFRLVLKLAGMGINTSTRTRAYP